MYLKTEEYSRRGSRSARERAADQRKLSARLLLVERSCVEELGS